MTDTVTGEAAVAALVLGEGVLDAAAVVLVNPLLRLRSVVEALGKRYGVDYEWSDPSLAVATRLDLVARADELTVAAVLAVVGEDDDVHGFRTPAQELVAALGPERASLVLVPGMAHALADEPGLQAAPQTEHAARVDAHAVEWLRRRLEGGDRLG